MQAIIRPAARRVPAKGCRRSSRTSFRLAPASVDCSTRSLLYLRRLRDLAPIPLAGTEGAIGPFFSPDGQWIGFASGGALKKMQLGGGAPQVIARAPNLQGASWGPGDTIVYAPEWRDVLYTVPAKGGAIRESGAQALGGPHAIRRGSAHSARQQWAERALRGSVVGRENHHGSRSLRGAEVAAAFHTFCETPAWSASIRVHIFCVPSTRQSADLGRLRSLKTCSRQP